MRRGAQPNNLRPERNVPIIAVMHDMIERYVDRHLGSPTRMIKCIARPEFCWESRELSVIPAGGRPILVDRVVDESKFADHGQREDERIAVGQPQASTEIIQDIGER